MSHQKAKAALFSRSGAEDGGGAAPARPRTTGMGASGPATMSKTAGMGAGVIGHLSSPLGGSTGRSPSPGPTSPQQRERRKEADEMRKQANKMLEKTWSRWKPDYFAAAPLLERAAGIYRGIGDNAAAVTAFTSAAECETELDAHAAAAKDYKEAAQIEIKAGREEEAAKLFRLCAEAWLYGGERGKSAEYLGRGARLLEQIDEEKAAADYLKAVEIMVPPDSDAATDFVRILGASEVFTQAAAFLVSQKQFAEALTVLERHAIVLVNENSDHSLFKNYLSQVVVCLAMGDEVRGDKLFKDDHLQNTKYLYAPECKVEEELLTAFKNGDNERLCAARNDRVVGRLDPAMARLAKTLSLGTLGMDDDDDDTGGDVFSRPVAPSRAAAANRGGGGGGGSGSNPLLAAGESSAIAAAKARPARNISDVRARIGALGAAHGVNLPPPPPPSRQEGPTSGRAVPGRDDDDDGDSGGMVDAEDRSAADEAATANLFARMPPSPIRKEAATSPGMGGGAGGRGANPRAPSGSKPAGANPFAPASPKASGANPFAPSSPTGRVPPPLPPRPNSPSGATTKPLPPLPTRPDGAAAGGAGVSGGGISGVSGGGGAHRRGSAGGGSSGTGEVDLGLDEWEKSMTVEPEYNDEKDAVAAEPDILGDDLDLEAEIAAARLEAAKLATAGGDGHNRGDHLGGGGAVDASGGGDGAVEEGSGWAVEYEQDGAGNGSMSGGAGESDRGVGPGDDADGEDSGCGSGGGGGGGYADDDEIDLR